MTSHLFVIAVEPSLKISEVTVGNVKLCIGVPAEVAGTQRTWSNTPPTTTSHGSACAALLPAGPTCYSTLTKPSDGLQMVFRWSSDRILSCTCQGCSPGMHAGDSGNRFA